MGEKAPLCHADPGRLWYFVDNQPAQSSFQLYCDCLSVFCTVQLYIISRWAYICRRTGFLAPTWKPPCRNLCHFHWTEGLGIGLRRWSNVFFPVAVSVIWYVDTQREGWPSLMSLHVCAHACVSVCVCAGGCTHGMKRMQMVWSIGSKGLSHVGGHCLPWFHLIGIEKGRLFFCLFVSDGGGRWWAHLSFFVLPEIRQLRELSPDIPEWAKEWGRVFMHASVSVCVCVCVCVSRFYCGNPLLTGLK